MSGPVRSASVDLDLKVAPGSGVRNRHGDVTLALFTPTYDTLYPSIAVRPSADNVASLGTAANRWTQVFAGTGTINTSDERTKEQIQARIDAWSEVRYVQFKFKDAVSDNGEDERWHIGVIAQEIEQSFARHGISAFDFGLL